MKRSDRIDRNSYTYRKWKADVIERDGHQCVRCGETEHLEAHHIKPYAIFPELATDLDNGITLCRTCHSEEHNKNYGKDLVIADKIAGSVHPFFRKLRDITFYASYRMDILRKFWHELPVPREWKKRIEQVVVAAIIGAIVLVFNLVKNIF